MAKADFTVELNPAQLRRIERALAGVRNGAKRAMTGALNDTARTGRTRLVRALADQTGLKQQEFRKGTRIERANFRNLQARVIATSKGQPLIKYAARQTKKGVTYRASKGKGGRKLIESAFIATMPRGHRGVFKRKSAARLPIRELFAPNPITAFQKSGGLRKIRTETRGLLRKNLERRTKALLLKANRK